MPDPRSILTAYPSTELEDVIRTLKPTKLNIYVDVKNIATSLFVEDVVFDIINSTSNTGKMDSTIFQSMITYASYWKRYALNKNLGCELFFCTDIGRSTYHKEIYNGYKKSRQPGSTSLPEYTEDLHKIRNKNFELAERVCNKIPGVHFFVLKYLESDFLPHYIITRNEWDENILHIICSNDKDMLQSLINPNIIMLYKIKGVKKLIKKDAILSHYTKFNKSSISSQSKRTEKLTRIDPMYIAAMMACIGDDGDDVPGIKGLGPMRLIDMFAETNVIKECIGTYDELLERVNGGGHFFKEDVIPISKLSANWNKVVVENKLVSDAFKMISYEMLIKWLEERNSTVKVKYINYIKDIMEKNNIESIPTSRALMQGLNNLHDNQVSKEEVDILYV